MLVNENGVEIKSEVDTTKVYPNRKMEAQGNFLIVRGDKPADKSEGGLHIPDSARETEFKGTVISAGKGEYLSTGQFVENPYKPGDRILFHPGGVMGVNYKTSTDPEAKAEMLLVLKTYDVYAVID